MKRFAIALAPLVLASAAFAQATLPDVPDTDESGSWSLVELQAVWTDLTEDTFKSIDTSADHSHSAPSSSVGTKWPTTRRFSVR